MQKEVKLTGLTSLKGLKVSPFDELENSKGVKVKPLIDMNNFVEKNKKVNPLSDVKSCIEDKINPETESDYMKNYKPFISEGVVSVVGDENNSQKVKILRDTGATQSLMLDSVLPLTENSFTGANVLISGIFPASVVTRSMKAKKEAIKEQGKEEIGLSGTFLENTDGTFRGGGIRKRRRKPW